MYMHTWDSAVLAERILQVVFLLVIHQAHSATIYACAYCIQGQQSGVARSDRSPAPTARLRVTRPSLQTPEDWCGEVCADLDHLNEDLRSHLKDWLNHLKDDVGFEGWRFDFVKGYGPQFVKEYVADTVGADTFNVGEYWVDCRCAPAAPRQRCSPLA